MSSHSVFRVLSLICIVFPSYVAGRGGGGRGRGGGIISGFGGGDGGDGDSLAPLFLEPFDAAIFAFCVIFGVVTGLQALLASRNIYQRILRRPPSIALPEFSVGPIFPTCLLLSTLMLTTYYVLYGVYWAVTNNKNVSDLDIPNFSAAYFNATNLMTFLADIFLISSILALLSHRERVLGPTSPVIRDAKMIFDAVLIVIILALGMGRCGLLAVAETESDIKTSNNIYAAYASFFFIAAIDIAVTSVLLYMRARRSPVNDHQISLLAAFVLSPLLFIYALYPLILLRINLDTADAVIQVRLASLIIGSITEFGVIATCLKWGIPVVPKTKKVVEES